MAVLLALASSLAWGVGDFLGGRVATRVPALTVTAASQVAGLALMLVAAPLAGGRVGADALALGAGAGLAGGLGLVTYFRALAIGPMGVVAPVAGATGAVLPVGWGLALGESVGPVAVTGIVLGLVAVVLATMDPTDGRRHVAWNGTSGPILGVVAGILFGLFFVVLDATPADSGLWSLVGARATSVLALGAVALGVGRAWPRRSDAREVVASGLLDSLANVLFLLATRIGLLPLVGLLSSLYPVVIVLLARVVLGERLGRTQVAGVVLAMAAVALVTLG